MQNEEDAQANNTHDKQIQLGCAFHRIESRGSLRYGTSIANSRSEVEPTPAEGLTSEKRNYNDCSLNNTRPAHSCDGSYRHILGPLLFFLTFAVEEPQDASLPPAEIVGAIALRQEE